MKSFGDFVYGDAGHDLIVRIKNSDGTVRDVTSATVITLSWRCSDGSSGTVTTGTIVSPGSSGKFRFENPASLANPGTAPYVVIEFIVLWTESAEVYKTRDLGRFRILRFP